MGKSGGLGRTRILALIEENAVGGADPHARDPLPTDDTSGGWAPGRLWINTASGAVFCCRSAASSAAVWVPLGTSIVLGMNILRFGFASFSATLTVGVL